MSRPTELKELMPRVIQRLKPRRGKREEKLQAAWQEIMSREEVKHSRIKQLKNGVLLVEVDSAPMMHHFSGKDKSRLLKELEERVEGIHIREIRTRISKE